MAFSENIKVPSFEYRIETLLAIDERRVVFEVTIESLAKRELELIFLLEECAAILELRELAPPVDENMTCFLVFPLCSVECLQGHVVFLVVMDELSLQFEE